MIATAAPRRPEPGTGTSIYVHVPFCVVKCGYCDFNSYVVEDPEVVDRFLSALDAELALVPLPDDPPSVFLGGGTPSHLDQRRFEALFACLRRHLDLDRCPEVSMEANPESMDRQKAATARAAGVRRLSLGVQSFHPHHLRQLDRAHDAERARRAYEEVRAAGFDNVSIDLMFSIPGETLAEWRSDLEAAVALSPDHLSCYNLTFEPGTRMQRDLLRGRIRPNDEELDRAMFLLTREVLGRSGYTAYEISNFAGRGGPCRHNDHYWLQGDYVGVGPGAASHRGGVRSSNLKPVEAWAAAVLAGVPPTATAETLGPRQRAREAVWLGIRRADGIDLASVAERLRLPRQDLFARQVAEFGEQGLLLREGDRIRLTAEGLLLADRVGAAFLAADG